MSADAGHDARYDSLTVVTDRLLDRVASLTRVIQTSAALITGAERTTTQVMLDDLQLVADSWRGLQTATAHRLDAAAADLAFAMAILQRGLDETHA